MGLKTKMGHNIDDGSLRWKCGMVVNKQQVWGQLVLRLVVTYCLPIFWRVQVYLVAGDDARCDVSTSTL